MEPAKLSNVILELSFNFAKEIIGLCDQLYESRKHIMANQLLKSGTSIGANIREAQGAESKADFIHKMKVAAKEAEETDYWLALLHEVYALAVAKQLQEKLLSIRKLLSKIISSSKRNPNPSH